MTSSPIPASTVCLMLTLLVVGCAPQQVASEKEKKPIVVRTVQVAEQEVQRTSVQPATVHAYYQAEIQAKVSGYVDELKADIGDVVKEDDALAVIDMPEIQKQFAIAQARVQLHQAQESQADAGVKLAAANVKSAQAKLKQAESESASVDASVEAANAEFDRTKDLVDRQSLQSRVLDEVRKKRDSEIARQSALQSAVTSASADVTVAEAKQSAAEAESNAAKAATVIAQRQLEELQVMVDYATLKAPFAGIVTDRSIDPGDMVYAAQRTDQPLFVVSHVDKLRVHIPVPEVDAAHVDRGDVVTLTFPSFSAEEPLTATVTRVAGSLDPSTRTMLVEAEIDNPDGKLLPGMFGQASIELSTQLAANILPARAVRFDESGEAYVYLVDQDDTVKVVQVTTGIDDGQAIEILSGVQVGQKVVDAHLQRFTTGQKVDSLN